MQRNYVIRGANSFIKTKTPERDGRFVINAQTGKLCQRLIASKNEKKCNLDYRKYITLNSVLMPFHYKVKNAWTHALHSLFRSASLPGA
jgi:hypothetical protein